ncbi:MAG: group III truncated hemoglobin [Cytophagales bacterium]|jgi:hemoglobin|nr:group III truncated hemoglobin [Cytophagales bacterium]MCA6386833.1 group III truncated hemoglobin [Cytophagales bacterium]MCA6390866.1 group III truncated hemoglobin [Cytophagales bacterium]MCA6395912.1 group III truncated hemoglobin [Cytophagales bacterium]MCA6397518.1 group III truncated hemoglobin [Cytophagales bacterium]
MKKDIESRADIEWLVNQFYNKVNRDTLLAPVFSHVDWPHHLPIMYNFWSSILLGDQSYQGNPFLKHIHLVIDSSHFNQWLALFIATVDKNFSGYKADEVKSRAQSIAGVFQHKMGLLAP